MILTLTPNPATDATYRVGALTLGETHRVEQVSERAGGKGINTASVLRAMGLDVMAVAPVAEASLSAFEGDLNARGIRHYLVGTTAPTRRSVAVVDDVHEATVFNEAGSPLPESIWDDVIDAVERFASPGDVLTVSGSLPPQALDDVVLRITMAAKAARLKVVLDVREEALALALAATPDLVKPNRSEALATLSRAGLGEELGRDTSAARLARALVEAGAASAVVSDGSAGLSLAAGSVGLRAWLPAALRGNPTGAGDALTAALAATLDELDHLPDGHEAWAQALSRGVAWSAAAVLQPLAGEVDPADFARLLPTVEIEETRS